MLTNVVLLTRNLLRVYAMWFRRLHPLNHIPMQQILKMLQACHEQRSPFPDPSFQFSYNPTPRLVHKLLPTLTQSLRVLHHIQRYPSNLKKSSYIVGER